MRAACMSNSTEPATLRVPDRKSAHLADGFVSLLNSTQDPALREEIWQDFDKKLAAGEMKPAKEYLTMNGLAEKLSQPFSRLRKMVTKGTLRPDAVSGVLMLFEPARLEEIRQLVAEKGGK